jgi:solute carrier family 15 oligopeptide transporter 1/oligopeptide transporter 2
VRFCNILLRYLLSLGYSEDRATSLSSAFNIMTYTTPLFGGIIADSLWGKYKTILYLSIVYCIGNIVNAVFSARSLNNGSPAGSFLGLFLISIGTGGIKPCVTSFGGDQFSRTQVNMLRLFFSVFYVSINAGRSAI